jgi:hypothetical protein
VAPNSAKNITSFYVSGVYGSIDTNTVSFTVPYGTSLSNLSPSISVSAGATVYPASGTARNFTTPQIYTVTAADSSTKTYTVYGSVAAPPLSSAKDITSFYVSGVYGSIGANTVSFTVPYGTSLSNLSPSISVSAGASISPASGTARNFNSSQTYTVTAEDSSTKTYTVYGSVAAPPKSSAALITAFTIPGQSGSTSINDSANTISLTMPYGTSLTSLTPTISVSAGATVNPASGTARNFTSSVNYTVTAENETTTKTYTVTVNVVPPRTGNDIIAFSISSPASAQCTGTISGTNISFTVPYGETTIQMLTPVITVSPGATVYPASGTARNFGELPQKTYTVTAEDGSTKTYTVWATLPKGMAPNAPN